MRLDTFSFDWREFLRSLILTIPLAFILMPFFQTFFEYQRCKRSIEKIQKAELHNLERTKKTYLARTLLDNPNFNI